ncbi:hypothetical protein GCM10022221_66470 [Actinocorallia aurea]
MLGEQAADHVLRSIECTDNRLKITGLVRATTSEEAAARILRERISGALLVPLAENLDVPQAQLRAALAGSQMIGLIMARHIIGIPALAETPAETLTQAVAPVLQHYLTTPTLTDPPP